MENQNREVTFKLKSRPLRCAYLVRNREDLLDAISLYTHLWGGAANAILPMPENEEEIKNFHSTLALMNPDYIFILRGELSSHISQALKKLPILVRPISKIEIEQHINSKGRDLLHLLTGSLSHMGVVLSAIHQNPLEESAIRLVNTSEAFSLEVALHLGLPSQSYRDYLLSHLSAKSFSQPEDIKQLVKFSLTITKLLNPLGLTLLKTTRSYDALNFYPIETNDEETLCLFLDDKKDIGITTAFWNCRWIHPINKIFVPRDSFLENINAHALTIIEFMPYIRALYVVTPLSRESALDLHGYLKSAFLNANREVSVKIVYQDFRFDWMPGTLSTSEITNFTRAITSEGCVRFDPYTPVGHEKTKFAFGYDAEIRFTNGRHLFSPQTLVGSHLLTNELWRLEYLDSNKDKAGELWLRRELPVRAATKGIAGISIPGRECFFFIHSDEIVITRQLKTAGFNFKPNEHTRYAQGLVKRLGGIEKVTHLISNGGVDVISVLAADGVDKSGLKKDKIISALIKKRGFRPENSREVIQQKLKPLLASGLLRRGYCYECQNCNLKAWVSLEEISEFIECKGCAEKGQLSLDDLEFSYKPNELAAQLVRQGGLAVLMTAATLKRIESFSSSFIQFGGDFLEVGNKNKFAEVDLFWLTDKALIISECKSVFIKERADEKEFEDKIERIKESLERNLSIAERIGASAVILGVLTNSPDISRLLSTVAELTGTAKAQKIGLHLALNGEIHLWGSPDGIEPRRIKLDELLVEEVVSGDWSVGESPCHYGGTVGSNGLFDNEILRRWESDLLSS